MLSSVGEHKTSWVAPSKNPTRTNLLALIFGYKMKSKVFFSNLYNYE